MEWKTEWPKEPGFYWVFGRVYRGERLALRIVEAVESGDQMYYHADNRFFYKSEVGPVCWAKIQMPDALPIGEIRKMEKNGK